jgi:metallo-beta-lactamase family protein
LRSIVAELTFIGAAGTVTGSKHLVTANGKQILIDCGLFQGTANLRALNDQPLPIEPAAIDAVIVTHGHLDHVGYLPKIVRDGFTGPIHCTPPTQAVTQIVLDDAAHLQQELQERGFEQQRPYAPPLYYDPADVERTMKLFRPVELHTEFDVAGAVKATLFNAGHILGSAFVALQIEGRRVLFSGDIGRYDRPLLFDPERIGDATSVICESTYADRVHPPQPLFDLRSVLLAGVERGGAIVIPAFAVERAQDILYAIAQIQAQDETIVRVPVHLDSPMAEKIDDLFERFPSAHKLISNDAPSSPFGVKNFTMHVTTEESKALNDVQGPHIIISASGMASGGRILHHLHNNLADPKATIVFCGYQSTGTLGAMLTHGAKTCELFNDTLPVRAAIAHLQGFSGHADRTDLLHWLRTCTGVTPHLYAVHGEPASAAALCATASGTLGWSADVAQRGTTVTL